MNLRIAATIAIVAVFCFGFGTFVGFALELYFRNNSLVLATIAIALAVAAWIGSGTDMVGLFRDMYRDRKKEQEKPILSLEEIFVTRQHLVIEGGYNYDTYSIKISIVKGAGIVDDCHVYLEMKGTKIRHFPTVWTDNDMRYMPISDFEYAKLFTMTDKSGKKELIFWFGSLNPSPGNPTQRETIPLDDIIQNEIIITLRARNGKLPEPKSMNLKQIIETAKEQISS
jgi:hypothetical protein